VAFLRAIASLSKDSGSPPRSPHRKTNYRALGQNSPPCRPRKSALRSISSLWTATRRASNRSVHRSGAHFVVARHSTETPLCTDCWKDWNATRTLASSSSHASVGPVECVEFGEERGPRGWACDSKHQLHTRSNCAWGCILVCKSIGFRDIGAGYVRTEEPRSSLQHFELVHARSTMAEPVPCGDSGWLKVADPSGSGRFYYCRPDTGETSWELPPGVCV